MQAGQCSQTPSLRLPAPPYPTYRMCYPPLSEQPCPSAVTLLRLTRAVTGHSRCGVDSAPPPHDPTKKNAASSKRCLSPTTAPRAARHAHALTRARMAPARPPGLPRPTPPRHARPLARTHAPRRAAHGPLPAPPRDPLHGRAHLGATHPGVCGAAHLHANRLGRRSRGRRRSRPLASCSACPSPLLASACC